MGKAEREKKTGKSGRPRRRWRWRKILFWGFAVVVLLPLACTLILRVVPPLGTPLMVLRLFEGEGLSKDWEPLEDISPHLPLAIVAAEDNRFCEHRGFDVEAIREALAEARQGGRVRGASTISMQTAKNVFLWGGRNYLRKGLEAYLTLYIETLWPKRRIIEMYMNVAEWAPGVYGAEAAARHHFGKSAAELTAREAALLAAVLPNPREWSAGKPGNYVAGRASTIQRRVGQLGPMLDCVRREA
ncbi:MAG: monofunctional biosynthetic peptidoglycan transglycosylase [Rhodovibrionaceae bacterium]